MWFNAGNGQRGEETCQTNGSSGEEGWTFPTNDLTTETVASGWPGVPDSAPPVDAGRPSFTPMSPVNQQTLANELNISRATVSRCFTNHPGINPSTRAKVFNLAARLGYKHMEMRTPAAEGQGRRLRAGVIICTDMEEFVRTDYDSPGQALLEGTSEFGLLQAFTTEVYYVDPTAETLDHPSYTRIDALHKRLWDGLLLIYPFPRFAIDHLMLRYPVVSLAEQYSRMELNSVDVDHYKGIATLINHLVGLGHRRIGFYTRQYPVEAGWSYRRFSAYVEKITRMGWPYREEDVVNVRPHIQMTLEESYDYVKARGARRGHGLGVRGRPSGVRFVGGTRAAWVSGARRRFHHGVRRDLHPAQSATVDDDRNPVPRDRPDRSEAADGPRPQTVHAAATHSRRQSFPRGTHDRAAFLQKALLIPIVGG